MINLLPTISRALFRPRPPPLRPRPAQRTARLRGPRYAYDGVGNRVSTAIINPGAGVQSDVYTYPATSNQLGAISVCPSNTPPHTKDQPDAPQSRAGVCGRPTQTPPAKLSVYRYAINVHYSRHSSALQPVLSTSKHPNNPLTKPTHPNNINILPHRNTRVIRPRNTPVPEAPQIPYTSKNHARPLPRLPFPF